MAAAWLIIPSLVLFPADLPVQAFVWRYIISPSRMGEALAALLGQFSLDRDACTISVLPAVGLAQQGSVSSWCLVCRCVWGM